MSEIKVINGGKKQVLIDDMQKAIKYSDLWTKCYQKELLKSNEECTKTGKLSHDSIVKLVFAGVKNIISMLNVSNQAFLLSQATGISFEYAEEANDQLFYVIDKTFLFLGMLTIRDLVTMFPITKEYDGEKYGWKDYFFTMEVLNQMDWDKPIGRDNIFHLLWDYQNEDLHRITGEYMTMISKLYRKQTGISPAEELVAILSEPSENTDEESTSNQTDNTSDVDKEECTIKMIK